MKSVSDSQLATSQFMFPEGGNWGSALSETALTQKQQQLGSLCISGQTQEETASLGEQTFSLTEDGNNLQALQIILYDDQGKQQIITIDQKTISDSLQKIGADKSLSGGSADDQPSPIVCSLSDITVQDGNVLHNIHPNLVSI